MSVEQVSPSNEELFQALEAYKWEDDPEFQSGLNSILSPDFTPDQVRQTTQRAKCFFFSRKTNANIDFDLYQQWLAAQANLPPPSQTIPSTTNAVRERSPDKEETTKEEEAVKDAEEHTGGADEKAKYPMSFDRIVELITTGQPIPGIRQIPNTLNAEGPTESTKSVRRKPWEVNAEGAGAGGAEGGIAAVATTTQTSS